ncbi:alpha-tocopherol transfer protein-like [Melitaea cinxia]|uniref:alpha-tocopherol transfer protein-like n=1 Tax=Melitaea cinxia TaxID=113334 RepID=UPI001E272306|nr:alpha-tocopherol transfer protein-like [Melitaea cinxia]
MNKNFEDINVVEVARFCCFLIQMRMLYEYTFAHHLVWDMKHLKASAVTKLNPIVLRKIEVVFTDSYKARVKGLHFINAPPFINKIIAIFNLVLKEKIAKRIHVHSTYEDLYKHISKEVLPEDYGGEEMSCQDISKHLKEFIKSETGRRVIEQSSKMVANETKRSSLKFNEEYMGMPGSFKQLNFD